MHWKAVLTFTLVNVFLQTPVSAQFSTILDVPPAIAPDVIGSSTQLNLLSGGQLPDGFKAGLPAETSTNLEVNIYDGLVGKGFAAYDGSVVNIFGGSFATGLGNALNAYSGSSVNISGGSVTAVVARSGSTVELAGGVYTQVNFISGSAVRIIGDDFRIDGVPVAGLVDVGDTVWMSPFSTNQTLSGTFANGTPFVFSNFRTDQIASGAITLEKAELPSIGSPMIEVPGNPVPLGIRAGQTLLVDNGGEVAPSFRAGWGSTLRIEAGSVGHSLETVGSHVELIDGSIGNSATFFTGSLVEVQGGSIGDAVRVQKGATLRVSGGRVGIAPTIENGAQLEISGGAGFDSLQVMGGIDASGIKIVGNEFRLNGQPLTNPELMTIGGSASLSINAISTLTCILADGTPFSMGSPGGSAPVLLQAAALPDIGPSFINALTDPVPLGIRTGQTLEIPTGAHVGDFFRAGRGSRVVVSGGTLGRGFDANQSEVRFSDGSLGELVAIAAGSVFTMTGGAIVAPPPNMSTAINLAVSSDSKAVVSGGRIEGTVAIGGEFLLAGGAISGIRASKDSNVQIYGTHFVIDGVDLTPDLIQNSPLTISNRDVLLSGTLADGTEFQFDLNSSRFNALANLKVVLVLPGDFNVDGMVDTADYTTWRDALGDDVEHGSGADGDFDGRITLADYKIWKDGFEATSGSGSVQHLPVPEPSAGAGLLAAAVAGAMVRRTKMNLLTHH
jgi:hypothetical protein